ncbi:MAG: hypothetical protein LBH06_05715 [Rikenellaceae bacterium]|nr:hypothetical protein [Rikenellaceae bacterium]
MDTFAKKLSLQGSSDYGKSKFFLSLYLVLEQLVSRPDSRYDGFFADIFDRNCRVPDDITIISWNYDSQFDIVYKEWESNNMLNIVNKTVGFRKVDNSGLIFKINGTAAFGDENLNPDLTVAYLHYGNKNGREQNSISEEVLIKVLELAVQNNRSNLSFAWEELGNQWIRDRILANIRDARSGSG